MNEEKRLGAMIVARYDSERYPGKVIAPLMGKPILAHLIEQLQELTFIDEIIVCTSYLKSDDPLEEIANQYGVGLTRGHPDILIERHMQCINEYNLDFVLSICGDAPFMDKRIVQRTINYVRTDPSFDLYATTALYDAAGFVLHAAVNAERYFTEYSDYYYKAPGKYRQLHASQYWTIPQAIGEEPPEFTQKWIDITDLVDIQQSLFKNTVDYPFELAMLELMCQHLGRRPQTIEDFKTCFKEIKSIKEIKEV